MSISTILLTIIIILLLFIIFYLLKAFSFCFDKTEELKSKVRALQDRNEKLERERNL